MELARLATIPLVDPLSEGVEQLLESDFKDWFVIRIAFHDRCDEPAQPGRRTAMVCSKREVASQ